MGDSALHVIK
jgi:hypothetical protein